MNHVDWTRISVPDLLEETFTAKFAREDTCGCPIDEVAVPFGSYNRRVIAKLRVRIRRRG
jgi:hypothetical protein